MENRGNHREAISIKTPGKSRFWSEPPSSESPPDLPLQGRGRRFESVNAHQEQSQVRTVFRSLTREVSRRSQLCECFLSASLAPPPAHRGGPRRPHRGRHQVPVAVKSGFFEAWPNRAWMVLACSPWRSARRRECVSGRAPGTAHIPKRRPPVSRSPGEVGAANGPARGVGEDQTVANHRVSGQVPWLEIGSTGRRSPVG